MKPFRASVFLAASAALLHYAMRQLAGGAVLFALGARAGELEDNAPAQQLVADLVAQAVVDDLEVVQVQEHQHHGHADAGLRPGAGEDDVLAPAVAGAERPRLHERVR